MNAATTAVDASALLSGRLHILIAMDVGEEVDLDRVLRIAAARKHSLPRRRRTPSTIAYRPAPVRLVANSVPVELPGVGRIDVPAEATVFDFGAVSLALRVPFELSRAGLAQLAASLADPDRIVTAARASFETLFEALKPAIADPLLAASTEEYFVFELPPGEPLPATGQLLTESADWLAGLVRLDAECLTPEEVTEALRLRLSYTPSDLFIAEWSAAVLIDRDCEETIEAIEFANLQLLEFRYIDQRLDDRLSAAYRLIHPLSRSWLPFWRTHARPLRELGDLRIEANSVFERTGNALKLIGDQYLARVYKLLGARFHLDDWQHSIERSLSTLEGAYRVVSDQAASLRTEFLELAIVLLIILEIVLNLIQH